MKKNIIYLSVVLVLLITSLIVYFIFYADKKLKPNDAYDLGLRLYDRTIIYYSSTKNEGADICVSSTVKDIIENDNKKYSLSNKFYNTKKLEDYLKSFLNKKLVSKELKRNIYLEKDNRLYCLLDKSNSYNTKYTGNYELEIKSIKTSSITYSISSTYYKEKCTQINCDVTKDKYCKLDITTCKDEQLEKRETTFKIIKENGNWVTSSFELFE